MNLSDEQARRTPCCNESLKPMKSLPKICKINMDILAYWGSHTKQVWCIAIWCVSHWEIINYWLANKPIQYSPTLINIVHMEVLLACCWRSWLEKVIKYMKFQNSPDFLQVTVECTCMTNQLEESIFVMSNLRPFGMGLINSVGIFSLKFLVYE